MGGGDMLLHHYLQGAMPVLDLKELNEGNHCHQCDNSLHEVTKFVFKL
jgi:hypothetical protein